MLLFRVALFVVLVVFVVDSRFLTFLVLGGWGCVGGRCLYYILVTALRLAIGSVSMRSDYSIFVCRDSSDCRVRVYVRNCITYGFLRELVAGLFSSGWAYVPV